MVKASSPDPACLSATVSTIVRTDDRLVDGDHDPEMEGIGSLRPEINIVSEMMRLTMTIAARILFESDIGDDTEVIERSLAIILDDTWRRIETPIDLSVISPIFHRQKFRDALRETRSGRLSTSSKSVGVAASPRTICCQGCSERTSQQNDTRFTDQELRDAVLTLLLAGHETTANALAWTFYLVSQAPRHRRKTV